jgi:hypothetical protein
MVLALTIIGLALLSLSVYAWIQNNRLPFAELPSGWKRFWRLRWVLALVVGLALGIASLFTRYEVDAGNDHYLVYGIPFMSYAFDQRGFDYVGPLTAPALLLNFITWALLPQSVFWIVSLPLRRRLSTHGA